MIEVWMLYGKYEFYIIETNILYNCSGWHCFWKEQDSLKKIHITCDLEMFVVDCVTDSIIVITVDIIIFQWIQTKWYNVLIAEEYSHACGQAGQKPGLVLAVKFWIMLGVEKSSTCQRFQLTEMLFVLESFWKREGC